MEASDAIVSLYSVLVSYPSCFEDFLGGAIKLALKIVSSLGWVTVIHLSRTNICDVLVFM